MHRVAILALDGVVGFELGIPTLVFGTAVHLLGAPRYRVRVCTPAGSGGWSSAEAGRFSVRADAGLEEVVGADTVILPARRDFAGDPPAGVVEAVLAAAGRGARIASICTGAFDLARTGLLDGKRATTHWRFADEFARRFPQIEVDPTVLYVDEGSVLTSAGAAAGIDLCLHLVRCDHGASFAADVARAIVAPPQRDGGQAQFLRHPDPADPDRSLSSTVDWLRANLTSAITVPDIAWRAGLSPRALSRRFRAEVGMPPLRWLLRERVLRAQHLLETTDLPVDRVAVESGFATAVTLRHHFARVVGTSPQSYRRTFRG